MDGAEQRWCMSHRFDPALRSKRTKPREGFGAKLLATLLAIIVVCLPAKAAPKESSAEKIVSSYVTKARFSQSSENVLIQKVPPEELLACCDEQPIGPFSHLPLGLKVLFGAPLIPIGFWIGLSALRNAAEWGTPFSVLILLLGGCLGMVGFAMLVG
jgi:hypothetical protein